MPTQTAYGLRPGERRHSRVGSGPDADDPHDEGAGQQGELQGGGRGGVTVGGVAVGGRRGGRGRRRSGASVGWGGLGVCGGARCVRGKIRGKVRARAAAGSIGPAAQREPGRSTGALSAALSKQARAARTLLRTRAERVRAPTPSACALVWQSGSAPLSAARAQPVYAHSRQPASRRPVGLSRGACAVSLRPRHSRAGAGRARSSSSAVRVAPAG
jgi:hypothetical protein